MPPAWAAVPILSIGLSIAPGHGRQQLQHLPLSGADHLCIPQGSGAVVVALAPYALHRVAMADQLNVRCPPALVEAVKAAAAAQRRTVGSLVREWVEAGLAGGRVATPDRVALLEARVTALEAAMAPTPPPAAPPALAVEPEAPAGGDLSTTEAMALAGGVRAGWSSWASRHQPGEVREVGGHRFELLGKVPSPAGGPDRLAWRLL